MSSAPVATPLTRNWTPATPTLSEAVALSATVPETVAPAGRRCHRDRRRSRISRSCIVYRDRDGRACGLVSCGIPGSCGESIGTVGQCRCIPVHRIRRSWCPRRLLQRRLPGIERRQRRRFGSIRTERYGSRDCGPGGWARSWKLWAEWYRPAERHRLPCSYRSEFQLPLADDYRYALHRSDRQNTRLK